MRDGASRGPHAIVVSGPAASGKTTFAVALARAAGYVLLDLDEVAGPMTVAALALLGRSEDAIDEAGPGSELRGARYASLLGVAAANLAIGLRVVIAAPFTRERGDPAAWAEVTRRLGVRDAPLEAGVPERGSTEVVLVYLDCPPELVVARLTARGEARDRSKLARPDRFARRHASRPPEVPYIAVDASVPTSAQVDGVLADLGLRRCTDSARTSGRSAC